MRSTEEKLNAVKSGRHLSYVHIYTYYCVDYDFIEPVLNWYNYVRTTK